MCYTIKNDVGVKRYFAPYDTKFKNPPANKLASDLRPFDPGIIQKKTTFRTRHTVDPCAAGSLSAPVCYSITEYVSLQ